MESHNFKQSVFTTSLKAIIPPMLFCIPIAYAEDQVHMLDTIVVTSESDKLYNISNINIDGFGTDLLQKTPASISVVNADLMADQHARVLSDVIKNDASIGDAYAPIGYYPNVISRGFALDLASSYLMNGNVIRGEQNVALENKERIEILKGISAIQSGMSTPGGVVNYVTKRPQDIQTLTFAANQHGQFSVAADVGGFTDQSEQLGYRINVVNEHLDSYVEHVNGERAMAAVVLDWQPNEKSKFEFDLEAQRFEQRSVPGYQLLDGKVPQHVNWKRLLGYQSWGKPVSTDSLNTSLKYNYAMNADWNLGLVASHSKSKIDDYSTFAWGCYDTICDYSGLGNTFDKNGNYDIYDYRNPDDTFKTNQLKFQADGTINSNWAIHHINYELAHTHKTRDRFASLNKKIGVGNIYEDTINVSPSTDQVGQSFQAINSQQIALSASDRIEWNDQWSTLIGGKWIDLDEEAHNKKREKERDTDLNKFLPQFAVTYAPTESTMLYASYAKGLSDGKSAPWFTEDDGTTLAPIDSVQYEIGLKQQVNQFLLTAALFDLRQDNQYTKPIDGKFYFIEEGKQHNIGLELGLNGALTDHISLTSSLALTKAELADVDALEYRNHQMQNVPKVRFATQLAYQVPQIEGLSILAAGRYSSSKYANKEATAKVDSYSVFDLGMHYQFKLHRHDAHLRLNVENIFNEKYWRDVGDSDGDNYLFLGAPRTATLSFNMNF
ncbi:TonB-dependent siderophore receptor [Acinetobacter sp. dk771]|uniref:TonB-dependent siderophore receptor n=1 Tax=Acinetobacter wanghuae TaxID=2662362 RepID=A0AA90W3Q1_9GAMM|nr:TonB-dependent siderophore receptor [Acinetobacter wanghuae]MQW92002.1 TonB-dependent siderophore receptor [Acinetobacter wanghuae]